MTKNISIGFALAGINLMAIITAYGIYYYVRPANQMLFQATVAAVLSIVAFFTGCVLIQSLKHSGLLFQKGHEFLTVLLSAFLFVPIVFIPLHYFTQGYLTSFGNIAAIWESQLPTNIISVFLVKKWVLFHFETINS